MKKHIYKIFLIFLLSVAKAAPIKSIEILGLNAISRGTVLNYLPVEIGDEYQNETSNQIINALYKTGFFKNIEVSQNNQILKINLQENPHIKSIKVSNYSSKVIEKEVLQQTLQSMDLYQGKIFNNKQLDTLIKQLKATYISKGYYGIKINKKIQTDDKNRTSIELDINEGTVSLINSMTITGAEAKEEEDLLDLFEIGTLYLPFITSNFSEKNYYSKAVLDSGIEALKSDYISSGYLDFAVNDVAIKLSDDKKNISINIDINEGQQYKISNIKFTGSLLNQSDEYLNSLLDIKKGDAFNRQKIIEGIRAISEIFTEQGYAYTNIDSQLQEDKKNYLIDLNINISISKKVYINRIIITGNTRTQDDIIRREFGITEGGLYSSRAINQSVAKIRRLGFFSKVQMKTSKVPGYKDRINIHINVRETKTGSIAIGITGSSTEGTTFNLGIKEKNFLGTGNTLNASFISSKTKKEINFLFIDPYFTKDNHSISYGVFSKSTGNQDLDTDSYIIDRKGFSLGYGFPLTKSTRLNSSISLSHRNIKCGTNYATSNPAQCSNGDKAEVKSNFKWSNNTLNNFRNPTSGQKNSLSLDLALPVGDFRYYKFDINHKSYYKLTKKLTLVLKSSFGISDSYDDKVLPPDKRYNGGSNKVRGIIFKQLSAGGGKLSVLFGASINAPLEFVRNNRNLQMQYFIDAGSIANKTNDFNDELRASIGFAINWLSPIGPLGIYVAKPLIKQPEDDTRSVVFTIGAAF